MSALEHLKAEIASFMEWSTNNGDIANYGGCWNVIYFRMKYERETEWEYCAEPCIYHYGTEIDFPMDFWEGQQEIELLGCYSLKYLVENHYNGKENNK